MSKKMCLVCDNALEASTDLPGLLQCTVCRFVTADTRLSSGELASLYGADYFHGSEYFDYVADREITEKNFNRRLATLLDYVLPERRGLLFEIGCAYGFFLNIARQEFDEVTGVDISMPAVLWARENLGLSVAAEDFRDSDLTRAPDVACMWDTIEHVERPDLYLCKLSKAMYPGGILAITTGDIGSLLARMRGKKWRQIHPPTHLHYFSKDTLTRLLERFGFKVRHVSSDGMYRRLEGMAYIVLKQKRSLGWLYHLLRSTKLLTSDLYLNLGDIMFVIAERTKQSETIVHDAHAS